MTWPTEMIAVFALPGLARYLEALIEADDARIGHRRHQDRRGGAAGGEETVGEIGRRRRDRGRDHAAGGDAGDVALKRIDREVAAIDQIAEIGERVERQRHATLFQKIARLQARGDVGYECVGVGLKRAVAGDEGGVGGGRQIVEAHGCAVLGWKGRGVSRRKVQSAGPLVDGFRTAASSDWRGSLSPARARAPVRAGRLGA